MDIVMGLVLGIIGLVVCLSGLRVFFVALPFIGFIVGFYAGAAGIAAILGESFLSSMTGVIVGIILGAVLAFVSYLFWYIGALLSAGSTGALIGSGLMNSLGVERGWVVFIVAALVAVLFFAIAFVLALPIYVVVVNTAFLGAAGVIAGVLLVFGQIERAELGYGITWATIEESWFWLLVWAALMIVGLVSQLRIIGSFTLPEDPWTTVKPV